MKSKFILIIPLLFAIASCDSGANNNDYYIKATEDLNNYEINTTLQNDFLNLTDASLMDENICGLKELSKPNKVHLSWESNKNDISYRVILSEKEDLSSPMVFKTNDNYLDISNLKVDTTYYYVIRSQDDVAPDSPRTDGGLGDTKLYGVGHHRRPHHLDPFHAPRHPDDFPVLPERRVKGFRVQGSGVARGACCLLITYESSARMRN